MGAMHRPGTALRLLAVEARSQSPVDPAQPCCKILSLLHIFELADFQQRERRNGIPNGDQHEDCEHELHYGVLHKPKDCPY